MSTNSENTFHRKLIYLNILIGVLLFFLTVHFFLNYRATQSDISEIKRTSFQKIDSLVSKLTKNDFNIDTTKRVGNKILIGPVDVQKMASQIKLLIIENQKENYRAESIIDKDYDRLTLYLSLGIGFMTLLGIFIPVLVNLITSIDTKSQLAEFKVKLEEMRQKFGDLQTEVKDITNEISCLKKSIAYVEVGVANHEVQHAVLRLLNLSANTSLDIDFSFRQMYVREQIQKIIDFLNKYANNMSDSLIVKDLEMVFIYDAINLKTIMGNKEGYHLVQDIGRLLLEYPAGGGDDQIKDLKSKLSELVDYFQ